MRCDDIHSANICEAFMSLCAPISKVLINKLTCALTVIMLSLQKEEVCCSIIPNQNRCVHLSRHVFVGLGCPYCSWYVCWSVCVSIQHKCVWSIVSVYRLSAMIRVTCLCRCLLSFITQHCASQI